MMKKLFSTLLIVYTMAAYSVSAVETSNINKEEVMCLAKNIYHEANNQPRDGQIAVGQITINRVESGKYPNSVCGVVYQKVGKTCQFSWVCQKKKLVDPDRWEEIYQLAKNILTGEVKSHIISEKYMNFHATYVNVDWSKFMRKRIQIGDHIFYAV